MSIAMPHHSMCMLACLFCLSYARRRCSEVDRSHRSSFRDEDSLDVEGDSANPRTTLATFLMAHPSSSSENHYARQQLRKRHGLDRSLNTILRVRGGSGLVDAIKKGLGAIPPITRWWFTLVLIFACLTHGKVLPAEALALDSGAIVGGKQLWRFFTSASYIGGITMQLLNKGGNLIQFGSALERSVGFGEFARVLMSMAATLSILLNLIGGQYVGEALIMAVTVLACQQTPENPARMFGLEIPTMFLPFGQLIMSYVSSNGQQFPWMDVFGMMVGYLHYTFSENMKPDTAVYKERMEKQQKAKKHHKKPNNSRRKPDTKKGPTIATLSDLPSTGG